MYIEESGQRERNIYNMEAERKLEEKKLQDLRETSDRLTAASHVQVEYFAKHQKIEGYYESQMPGRLFGCDRLMKQDNMFGTLQLGYNPNRERVFLFANMKTSRYDTVASRYQKEMKEYQQKSLLKGDNENRAYVSRRWEMSTVLIEKRENKPWTKRSIASYLGRANLEAVRKNLPFFIKDEEQKELDEKRQRQKQIQKEVWELRRTQAMEAQESTEERPDWAEQEKDRKELQGLRAEAVQGLSVISLLESILTRKDALSRTFLRRINYAYDFQKKDIKSYYREKRKTLEETATAADTEEDHPGDNT